MLKSLNRLLTLLIVCAVVASGAVCADLAESIDSILQDPALKYGVQAVSVKSLKTGKKLYEHNADLLMIPASNFKLLVSSAILEHIDPNFTFETEVYSSGKISNGVLNGDLIIKGAGDPVLSTSDLDKLAQKVKLSGIRVITGNIIADDYLFDRQRLGSAWT